MKKRMNMKKRLGVAAAVMAMTTSMAMTALAVPTPMPNTGVDHDFGNNSASTNVNLVGMTDSEINGNLSATVPLNVRLAVKGNGDIQGPTNYQIKNTTLTKGIKVTKIAATAEAGYILNGTAGAGQLDIGDITMQPRIGDDQATPGDSIKLAVMESTNITQGFDTNAAQWTLAQVTGSDVNQTKATVLFGGHVDVTKLSTGVTGQGTGEKAFTARFTIAVAP